MSVALGGIGSDAISDVPVREKAKRTSGWRGERLLDLELHRLALVDRGAGDADRLDEDVALVELRQELLPQRREGDAGQRQRADRDADREARAGASPLESRLVAAPQPAR